MLNLINYSWYIPKISGIVPRIRGWHPADVIGKYMVISFGNFEYNEIHLIIIIIIIIFNPIFLKEHMIQIKKVPSYCLISVIMMNMCGLPNLFLWEKRTPFQHQNQQHRH